MTKRMLIEGVTVPAPCPVCAGRLTWQGRTWRLTCSGCGLAGGVTLHPDEARDLAWHLALPGLQDTPIDLFLAACLAVHHLAGADVEPEVQVISTKPTPTTHKARILPVGAETPEERAERLAEQARLNGVDIRPIRWNAAGVPYLFRATSQERDADNRPVRTYEVEVSAFRATCECPAGGICAHLLAVKDWLLDWNAVEREREREIAAAPRVAKTAAQIQAAGKAAYADLYGS